VSAARIGHFIYVIGGFEAGPVTSSIVERCDISTDSWSRVRPMPVGLNHAATATWGGKLYVVGGYSGRSALLQEVSSLYRYDPGTDRWARLPGAPTKRAALTAAVIKGKLYAAGGAFAGQALKTLEIYDIAHRRWRKGPSMTVAREHLAGTALGGSFYVLAGRAAGVGNLTTAERYDPGRRRWRTLPPLPKATGGTVGTTVNGSIVVFGGEEAAGTIATTEQYDRKRRRWRLLAPMRTPRHGLGAASYRGRIYAVEGGPQPGFAFSNVIEALRVG